MIGPTGNRTPDPFSKDRSSTECSRLFSAFFLFLFSVLVLSSSHLGKVRAFVVFRRCCWRKVESTWGRVASMAPAANGRAALQTLISCRFRGPSRFYLSASKSAPGSLLFSLRSFSSRSTLLVLSPPRAICMELLLMKFVI